jgi:hypothetical protein
VASAAVPPRPAAVSGPSDEELERGILDAIRMGLGDVARTLSGQLEARRRVRAAALLISALRIEPRTSASNGSSVRLRGGNESLRIMPKTLRGLVRFAVRTRQTGLRSSG